MPHSRFSSPGGLLGRNRGQGSPRWQDESDGRGCHKSQMARPMNTDDYLTSGDVFGCSDRVPPVSRRAPMLWARFAVAPAPAGGKGCTAVSRDLEAPSANRSGTVTARQPDSVPGRRSPRQVTSPPGQARQAPANLVTGEASLNRCGILFMIVLKAASPTALVWHSGGCWRSGPFARLRERRRVADRDLGACVSLGAGLAGLSAQAYIGRLKCARFRKADRRMSSGSSESPASLLGLSPPALFAGPAQQDERHDQHDQ